MSGPAREPRVAFPSAERGTGGTVARPAAAAFHPGFGTVSSTRVASPERVPYARRPPSPPAKDGTGGDGAA